MLTSIEICAGAGGQALGLEMAGFEHLVLVEYEQDYCNCLRTNRGTSRYSGAYVKMCGCQVLKF